MVYDGEGGHAPKWGTGLLSQDEHWQGLSFLFVLCNNIFVFQLENEGGKLLGMTRGVEAPTFPQFVQVAGLT